MNASSLSQSFIAGLQSGISEGHFFSEIIPAMEENESELVRGVLHMLQGFSSSLFYWNSNKHEFCVKTGIYASRLFQASLHCALDQFIFCGTCLKLVELFVKKVEISHDAIPTLRAFAGCVSSWLKRLRDISLEEETKSMRSSIEATTTLLYLGSSLSSVCSGAEYLFHIVYGAIPCSYFKSEPCVPACEFATHILDHLFLKLNEGSEESYHMLVAIFTGTLLPYLEGLHSWLSNGTLDDPFEEMFFCANEAVSIGQPEFWEKSYFYRKRLQVNKCPSVSSLSNDGGETLKSTCKNDIDVIVCPLFLKDTAKAIVSAGKSLQLFRHVHSNSISILIGDIDHTVGLLGIEKYYLFISQLRNIVDGGDKVGPRCSDSIHSENGKPNADEFDDQIAAHFQKVLYNKGMGMLSLSEIFLISLVGLIGDWTNKYAANPYQLSQVLNTCVEHTLDENDKTENNNNNNILQENSPSWLRFMIDRITKKIRLTDTQGEFSSKLKCRDDDCSEEMMKSEEYSLGSYSKKWLIDYIFEMNQISVVPGFYPENPNMAICRNFLMKNKDYWDDLNISSYSQLPSLNDESLRKTIFGEEISMAGATTDQINTGSSLKSEPSKLSDFECIYQGGGSKTLNSLFPFPTFLPCCKETTPISELIPFQNSSSLASSVLHWIQSFKPKISPLPAVIIRECLTVYIKKQVDHVGKHILLKLMSDWKLMDELGVLRAIYLLGSGDLLQQFLTVIFDKLDRGNSLDDEFELNTMLQDSIRNSADGRILTSPDSLVISITKYNFGFGIDALDIFQFTYKVPWPLDLIVNSEAINKYNQVMGFLLKVKRAKFALDKARKWMWKCKGKMSPNHKRHLLMEQKLLHFVDAFHQYVMDRVFHSAWLDFCNGMISATSLDEVIEVHEAYLLSIQRQCFVAPDKLWALIASRIKIILGLALDFYSVQQTLVNGGAVSAIKTRCEMEVDRIEKQFDDCIAFLLRVLSFKLNVGHFPHLADLVTRINYNYFYMSANGNLLTVPSFETSIKSAKPFAGRADP